MLFKQKILDRIAAGEVTAAFRRWRRPTVKAGGSIRTPAGVLAIEAVDRVAPSAITDRAARKAGFSTVEELRSELGRGSAGEVYRIAFRLSGADPRIALRGRSRVNARELKEIAARLARFDGRHPWTKAALALIGRNPGVPAAKLAMRCGRETAVFKRDVRKLKELGLTESLKVGYRLSPRGRAVLALLGAKPLAKA